MNKQNLQIALETGFGGGSITLFADGSVVDFRTNDITKLKADNLLEEISPVLRKNNLSKRDINKIVYSKNNGSQTGLKIGESLAKGLGLGLNIEVEGRDLFECILKKYRKEGGLAVTVVVHGKNDLECRFFENYKFTKIPLTRKIREDLPENIFLKTTPNLQIFTQMDFIQNNFANIYESLTKKNLKIIDLGSNLSQYLI